MKVVNNAGNIFRKRSLRARMVGAISGAVLLVIAGFILFGAMRIRDMSFVQIQHEGFLLANTVEAAISHFASDGEVERIQEYIQTLIRLREKNDLEINVLFMRGEDSSEIVASNIIDNIEGADEEEHEATLQALKTTKPSLLVEIEGEPEDEEDLARANDPNHPDFYFPAGSRLLSITSPLVYNGKAIGSVNIKLSLYFLDRELTDLTQSALIVLLLGSLLLAFVLFPFLNRKVFKPLSRLASQIHTFGTTGLSGELIQSDRRDEIGILENEFNNMVQRVENAEQMRRELEKARAEKQKHEVEARFRQAQKMEALGTLAGGIAHDFNNILTPIIGYTQITMEHENVSDKVHANLQQVNKASLRAKELVKQILAFSRQSDEEKTPLNVGAVVKETLKLLRSSMPTNIEISATLEDNNAIVMANATHIHQIILNLVTNGSQAMLEKGGSLDIKLQTKVLLDKLEVSSEQVLKPGNYLHLSVADSGQGISSDAVERIFEPYFTTKKEGEGTGLGLAMVHGIVQDMEGAISVKTSLGKGTQFDIFFPTIEKSDIPVAQQEQTASLGSGELILIVDDEEPVAQMIGIMLDSMGYKTAVANDPKHAIELLKSGTHSFDLIISDIAMPHMTGIEFAKELLDQNFSIPIVLCSGYTGRINWRIASTVGIRAVVPKPIDKNKMAHIVRKVLDTKNLKQVKETADNS